ncbi:MAG: AtpZ/AtpI family protein [Rickettsia endosymbiont of Ixodes persulcatus]|nr:AtpZ/AtpI family protein [Rickettsia endosymbiont of Ixodes persulcatus]MCZ6903779.1 AtpZ/AtpI family protein [Rickettsia endosymbiont of Ixodes persulcatus]MCZ6909023.1 AtpZ/AtpI family protein [Rickettsia endosymbiont of Ixodes persulcatus]MCZ6910070.1 AtpZ/AtpI family protein [Rickettsia endosymbiont of Ixodes persulcatus]MCZ6914394.1 AtpZ/AtpI family protein [Rickettsia endosymbiont of Ixodes persulcatus]
MDTEKLNNIKARIKDLKTSNLSNSKVQQEISPFTIAIDLVSGTMVGVVSGIFTDKFFNSKPLFLIIFTIIGMIAGFNIIRQKVNNKR